MRFFRFLIVILVWFCPTSPKKKEKKEWCIFRLSPLLSVSIATILDLLSQRSRRETCSNCSVKERGTSFIFVTFILSLLDLLRLCYPFIPLFVTVCFSDLSFCYMNFNFNLLYLSRLVTKGKEESIVNYLVYWYSAERLSEWKRSCSWKQGTFLFIFSHLSFHMVLALLWL